MRDVLGDTDSFFVQKRPGSGWETLYTAKGRESIYYINVANVGEVDCNWSMCIAPRGKSYSRGNDLVWEEALQANDNDVWCFQIPLFAGQKVGVRSSSAGDLTFTAYGVFR